MNTKKLFYSWTSTPSPPWTIIRFVQTFTDRAWSSFLLSVLHSRVRGLGEGGDQGTGEPCWLVYELANRCIEAQNYAVAWRFAGHCSTRVQVRVLAPVLISAHMVYVYVLARSSNRWSTIGPVFIRTALCSHSTRYFSHFMDARYWAWTLYPHSWSGGAPCFYAQMRVTMGR